MAPQAGSLDPVPADAELTHPGDDRRQRCQGRARTRRERQDSCKL